MTGTVSARLTDELVGTAVEKAFKAFRRTGDLCRKGLLTGEEFRREMTQAFCGVFMGLFSDNKLELRLTGANFPQFAREYEEYLKGNCADGPDHLPWLFDVQGRPREAQEGDRKRFFGLMETFRLAPEYFEPAPEGMPVPDLVPVHMYSSAAVYGTHFRCVDDGGLLTDADPEGRTYRLKNDLGLEAVLTVREDRRQTDRKGLDFDEIVCRTDKGIIVAKAEFLAEGHIEGYTARERSGDPAVLIRTGDCGKKVSWLAYWESPADRAAREAHPLWREYRRWCIEKETRRKVILDALFDGFRQPESETH
ncbi:MAG: hypothetical protein J5569_07160 [Oscillospiraceae bacterium]|nr:hypothetical protein [Oscillospiraceae bacterium]